MFALLGRRAGPRPGSIGTDLAQLGRLAGRRVEVPDAICGLRAKVADRDRRGLGHVDQAGPARNACGLRTAAVTGLAADRSPGRVAVTGDGQGLGPGGVVKPGGVPTRRGRLDAAPLGIGTQPQCLPVGETDFQAGDQPSRICRQQLVGLFSAAMASTFVPVLSRRARSNCFPIRQLRPHRQGPRH